jgi:hypothetical protein
MYSNAVLPTLMRALAYLPDPAQAGPEADIRPIRPISPAAVVRYNHQGARRRAEARLDAILLALGREAITTRLYSLTCSVMR